MKKIRNLNTLELEGNPIEAEGALFLLLEPTQYKSWNLRIFFSN
jgi:hypothetical protein